MIQAHVDDIHKRLQRRQEEYPASGPAKRHLQSAVGKLASDLLSVTEPNLGLPDSVSSMIDHLADYPVFICGSMKSGTSLMVQLLDGHPDLHVMPGDSRSTEQRERWDHEETVAITSYGLGRMINPTGKEPFWFIGPHLEELGLFVQTLRLLLKRPDLDVFQCIMLAALTAQRTSDDGRTKRLWIEKTPHNELYTDEIRRRFPNARFIHMIRDPLHNISSIKRFASFRDYENDVLHHALNTQRLLRAARSNRERYGEEGYHLVRYEDLVESPRHELTRVCDFLGIPFTDSLSSPTQRGLPAGSNSSLEEDRVRGQLISSPARRPHDQGLTAEEMRIIVTVLYDDAIEFGYDWSPPEIKCHRSTRARQLLDYAAYQLRSVAGRRHR